MATPVAAMNSSKLLIRIGDGAEPTEVFTHPCMINTSRGIEFGSAPTESLIPFCPPDEDLPGWIEREVDALTATVTGAGIFDSLSLDTFWDWYKTGESKNLHIAISIGMALEGGYWVGPGILSGFSVTGPGRREKVTFDCTILSDGQWSWVDAVA